MNPQEPNFTTGQTQRTNQNSTTTKLGAMEKEGSEIKTDNQF